MSAPIEADPARIAELGALYDAQMGSEVLAASQRLQGSDRVAHGGDSRAPIVLVKGLPGPAEESGGAVLSGPDGEAAARALEALGLGREYFAVLSRPVLTDDTQAVKDRLRALIEAADPGYVVALDEVAATDVAGAFGSSALAFGRLERVSGRLLVAVDGLEASLSEPSRKKRVWVQFKALVPPGPLW